MAADKNKNMLWSKAVSLSAAIRGQKPCLFQWLYYLQSNFLLKKQDVQGEHCKELIDLSRISYRIHLI